MNVKKLAVAVIAALIAPTLFAADGAATFKSKCAMCHGPDGAGQTSMGKTLKLRDLGSPEVQKQTDAEMTKIINDGKGKMPPYKAKLSAAEVEGLVAFLRTLKN